MKKLTSMIMAIAVVLFFSGSAIATPFGSDNGVQLQGVLDGITINPVGDSSIDVTTDYLDDVNDSTWDINGTGASVTTMVIELTGFIDSNSFGVYNNSQYVELFAGADEAGDQVYLAIQADGSVFKNLVDTGIKFLGGTFGYYIDSSADSRGRGGLFHSDTALNADGADHMLAYQGVGDRVQIDPWAAGGWDTNEYILAFEDMSFPGTEQYPNQGDFADLVVMVESVTPVPEPTTLILFGSGLLGLCAYARKRRKN